MPALSVDPDQFAPSIAEDPSGPLIPMVVSLTFPGMDRGAHELQESFTRIAFDAVRWAGGRPRLVDSAAPSAPGHAELLAAARGIVFLGGGDVAGACYGYAGPPPANEYGVDQRADEFCIAEIRAAVARDIPTLAICRGSQLLGVAFGGTLIPDIENWPLHRGNDPLFIDEEVRLEPDSEIARILGRTEVTVRNGHHQAVATVGPELRVTARAHDGIIEGTEHRTARWVVGMQWHPEEPRAHTADRSLIFGELVARAGATQ
ncbi:gamma-glutamyl-gamma-aminobutyrate hydrolase family protein [Leucobacter luti]|uniref:Putative glutamine amidotransferase n=1 Tax=Leucobacter luti TaxID=340320 RepID=A0A4Q7TZR1_9MICO|nr:gamma-glutamyl-gamma-aminobutyrate hydrolase family protein [Leucobacter luti]MBL3698605.1 gamma-glutamyl-gamma-aminobutyrate hydrolase family protein [Leucobacter luti]RZT65980.1 putative glutamine amidotransferase [Leucobacter luti]